MKKLALVLIVVFICPLIADSNDVNTIAALNAEIQSLKASIESKNKIIAALKAELTSIKNEKAKIVKYAIESNDIMYLDKPRSRRWFNMMYKDFFDKIASVKGKYIDISGYKTKLHYDVYKVFQIINDNEILVVQGSDPVLHVFAQNGKFHGLTDDAFVNMGTWDFIYAGTYEYTSVLGSKNTIKSYMFYEPLTQKQFEDALRGGLELYKETSDNGRKLIP